MPRPLLHAQPWHPALADEIRRVAEVLPASARETLGAPFFVTFWQLTLHDILYPKERYDAEITRLRSLQRDVATLAGVKAEDKSHFVESVIATATGLSSEAAMHLSAKNRVTRRLGREKAHWFSSAFRLPPPPHRRLPSSPHTDEAAPAPVPA